MENEKGKIIIPIVSILAIAGIVAVVILSTNKYKKFELPSRITIEEDIKSLGYDTAVFDEKNYRSLGLNGNFYRVWARYNDKDKTKDRDMSISYISYDEIKDCQKAFDDFYVAAQYVDKKSDHRGTLKYYQNNEKMTGYVLYNTTMLSDGLVDNYAISLTNENDLLNPQSDFLYGGVYMRGKSIVYITTSNMSKTGTVDGLLEKYSLPKP